MKNIEGTFRIGNFADRVINKVRLDVVSDLITQIAETIPSVPLDDAIEVVIAIVEIELKDHTFRPIQNIEELKAKYFDWFKEKVING